MPKISVIIPVYNSANFLEKCLGSVCNQTLPDIEIICINDCSTDNSIQILNKFSDKIKIINLKKNKGVSFARNLGIRLAKGEYLGFVDSDDFIGLDFYEKLYNQAITSNSDVVKGNIYNYDLKSNSADLTDFYDMNGWIKRNPAYFYYGFTSAIYKTKFVKNFGINFPNRITHFEDPYFSIKVCLSLSKIDFVDNAKYYYVKHSNSSCAKSKTFNSAKDFAQSCRLISKMINTKDTNKISNLIFTSFLLRQLIPWCSDISLSNEARKIIINEIIYVLKNNPFGEEELLKHYFEENVELAKKHIKTNQKFLLQQLRMKMKREKQYA